MQHLIIDFTSDRNLLGDIKVVTQFLKSACSILGMEELDTRVYEVNDENPGVTGFMVITTSHITIHTFTSQGEAWVDILSCKPFTEGGILGVIQRIFSPATIGYKAVSRSPIKLNEVSDGKS